MFQQNLTRSWYVTGPEWGDFRVVLPLCSVRSLQNRSDILGHKSTLVTANVKEFRGIQGLLWEDWAKS